MVHCTFYNFLFPFRGNNSVLAFALTRGRGMGSIKNKIQANSGESHDNTTAHIKRFQLIT